MKALFANAAQAQRKDFAQRQDCVRMQGAVIGFRKEEIQVNAFGLSGGRKT